MRIKGRSLKLRLLKSLSPAFLVLIAALAGLCYYSAEREVTEVYDSQLITAATVLALISKDYISEDEIEMGSNVVDLDKMDQKALDEYAKWRSFRIWKNGKLAILSDNSRLANVPPSPKGFSDIDFDGSKWRVFTLYQPEDDTIVEVGEKHEARIEIISDLMFGILAPLLIGLPLLVFLVWKAIQFGLKDLNRFANALKLRSPNDLSQIEKTDSPTEILPVVEAINLLLAKLETSLIQERLFTDNAAHELRTPLATLNIQMQVILNAKDEEERRNTILELYKGVERASHLLDQLLTLARINNQQITSESVNLYEVVSETIKLNILNAVKKNIEISLSGDETIILQSNKTLLAVLISNLIDNSIKYSPEKSEIEIVLSVENQLPVLMVIDNGIGIPISEYENVFNRFYRLPGNETSGSGLGLAIVKHITDILKIKVNLFLPESGQGLGVKLLF